MKKRIVLTAVLCLLLALGLCLPAAAENNVSAIEIDVALQQDGSARITQIWDTDSHEGTEFYLYYRDNGYLSITDFTVQGESGTYKTVEEWDIDASFAEKAGRCGIHPVDDGVELCWGITEYGSHRYTLSYTLHQRVGGYNDGDGFNYRFIDDMSTFPTNVSVTIRRADGQPLTDEVADIWGFGYDGEIVFDNGMIRANTFTPLESGMHLTLMVRLEKGQLDPYRLVSGSFEEVKERAFDGSDYEDDLSDAELIVMMVALIGFPVAVLLTVLIVRLVLAIRRRLMVKKAPYFRELPCGGDLNVAYKLAHTLGYCKEGGILGARLMRLIADGCLVPADDGENIRRVSLNLVKRPGGDAYDQRLYDLLDVAAGKDDILQPKELEKYSKIRYKKVRSFITQCGGSGERVLKGKGCLKRDTFSRLGHLSPTGREQLSELLGFMHYLKDFSLIHEREVTEVALWRDFMVYAVLLGMADQVAAQLRRVYPDELPQIEEYRRQATWSTRYHRTMYRSMLQEQRAREAAAREAAARGSGGGVSFGGGGGFSGGGGGGSR